MKTWKEYKKENIKTIIESKLVSEVVHQGMVGIHELMTDDDFLNWFEKLSDSILNKLTMFEIYRRYMKEKKRK